jgi:probable blue pigment (indigoidine) exporter
MAVPLSLFGFIMAAWLLKDVISIYTVVGVIMVIAGLAISRINTRKNEVVLE